MAQQTVQPRTFFINESHELTTLDKAGGGRIPQYQGISWQDKSLRISRSLTRTLNSVRHSRDPLRDDQYFVVARPEATLKKRSANRRKAPDGSFEEPTSFGGTHGLVFDRLGLDLIQVTEDGKAIVHGDRERFDQLLTRSQALPSLGIREQVRWATIEAFEPIPLSIRVDEEWLSSLRPRELSDVLFELQPLLNRLDADRVLRTLAEFLADSRGRLTSTGTDFSGRYWFRGKATLESIQEVARDFFSVQAIHPPLFSTLMAVSRGGRRLSSPAAAPTAEIDARTLPCVAVVDLGVPSDHTYLAPFRRGQFVPQDALIHQNLDHASFVASRVVFGDYATPQGLENARGQCSFYDAVVGDGYSDLINDKTVMDAIRGVRGAAPDVRVFNLSIGDKRPIATLPTVEQREKRLLLQDLDNFAFANDVVLVVAAGNSPTGVSPTPAYPHHYQDAQWALGPWACGFNTFVCGSYVDRITPNALVTTVGWPSAFSRVGPGLCAAPVPSFCAPGGNSDSTYHLGNGHGVWGLSGSGVAEDRSGTSFSAPLLAREAAFSMRLLQQHCAQGSRPFAITIRAFLALTAKRTTIDLTVSNAVARTLGAGHASSARLESPIAGSAVLIWQGIIETSKEILRVQIPVPQDWLASAVAPVLRLVVSYDPPVNEAATVSWACRRVNAVLHPGPEAAGVRGPNRQHETYPLFSREYKLKRHAPGSENAATTDLWVIELQYEEIFHYAPGMDFDPRQRVAFAAELVDLAAEPLDPQPFVQALPVAGSLNRLSSQAVSARTPVLVRTRRR